MAERPAPDGERRFGPGLWIWLLPIGAVLLAIWTPPGISTRGPSMHADPIADRMLSILLAGSLLLGFACFATSFVVTRDGVERRRFFFFRRRFPWEDIARVGGRRVYARARYGIDAHTGASVTTIVLDRDGEVLFRVGPWIRGRRHLARILRDHTKN